MVAIQTLCLARYIDMLECQVQYCWFPSRNGSSWAGILLPLTRAGKWFVCTADQDVPRLNYVPTTSRPCVTKIWVSCSTYELEGRFSRWCAKSWKEKVLGDCSTTLLASDSYLARCQLLLHLTRTYSIWVYSTCLCIAYARRNPRFNINKHQEEK